MSKKMMIPCWSFFYYSFISLVTCGAGAVSIYYGTKYVFLQPIIKLDLSLVTKLSLASGIFLGASFLFWALLGIVFIATSIHTRVEAARKRKQGGASGHRNNSSSYNNKKVGRGLKTLLSMSFIFCVAVEMAHLGILWYYYIQFSGQYYVENNCFCSAAGDVITLNTTVPHNCGEGNANGQKNACLSFYKEELFVKDGIRMFTESCQDLYVLGDLNFTCLEFKEFWLWFSVLRVLLPVAASLQIFSIVNHCCSLLGGEGKHNDDRRKNSCVQDTSWISLHSSAPKPAEDSFYHITNISHYTKEDLPMEERLGPYGQEKEDVNSVSLFTKPSTLRTTNQFLKIRKNDNSVLVGCSLLENKDEADCSVTRARGHNYSTPVQNQLDHPDFDISRVAPTPLDSSSQFGGQPVKPPDFSQPHPGTVVQPQQSYQHDLHPRVLDGSGQCFRSSTSSLASFSANPAKRLSLTVHSDLEFDFPSPPVDAQDRSWQGSLPPPQDGSNPSTLTDSQVEGHLPQPPSFTDNNALLPSPHSISRGSCQPKAPEVVVEFATGNNDSIESAMSGTQLISSDAPLAAAAKPQTSKKPKVNMQRRNSNWMTSPEVDRLVPGGPGVHVKGGISYSDIRHIAVRARHLSTSSQVDWSKMP